MPSHICPKCNKDFNRKSNYDYHINKKSLCKILNVTENAEMVDSEILNTETVNSEILNTKVVNIVPSNDIPPDAQINVHNKIELINNLDVDVKENNNIKLVDNLGKNVNENDIEDLGGDANNNICPYCNLTFTRKNNLNRHIKVRCKSKKYNDKLEILKTENDKLKTEINKLKIENTELQFVRKKNIVIVDDVKKINNDFLINVSKKN